MRLAASHLQGEHDFRTFSAATRDTNCVRELRELSVSTHSHYTFPLLGCYCAQRPALPLPVETCPCCGGGDDAGGAGGAMGGANEAAASTLVRIRFVGSGFLKHQCRRLAGLLVKIGSAGAASRLCTRLSGRSRTCFDRRVPGAPACGLWLESVSAST